MFKTANIGAVDRLIRLVVGISLILLPFFTGFALWENPVVRWGAVAVGAVLLATAAVRFCPAYRLIGVRTCRAA